jgi:hypothetical protein
MSLKSFLCTMAIFCGGYAFSTILDEVVDAGEKYFRVQTSTYKTDSNGYIICSPEKPKITNADLRPLTLNASGANSNDVAGVNAACSTFSGSMPC